MSKYLVLAGLIAFWVPHLASAEQSTAEFSPASIWQRFKSTCNQVITDPDRFLSAIARPGPRGERVISVSPDRNVVSVYQREANGYDEVELHLIGDRQIRDCSVIGEFYNIEPSQLASDFVEVVSSEEGVAITGGHAPQDYAEEGGIYTVNNIFLYAIDGVWPAENLIVIVHVIGGELQLYVQQTID